MTKNIVFLTIGEAPRTDLKATFDRFFTPDDPVRQEGLLDGLTKAEAEELFGVKEDSPGTLTSRLLTGESVVMGSDKVEKGLQLKINQVETSGADMIVILCTGSFNDLHTREAKLIEPEKVTIPLVKEKYGHQQIGVLVPLSDQVEESVDKWSFENGGIFASASPYAFVEEEFQEAAKELQAKGAEVIVLDCMGYSDEMKRVVEEATDNALVVQSNEVLFQYIIDLMEEINN